MKFSVIIYVYCNCFLYWETSQNLPFPAPATAYETKATIYFCLNTVTSVKEYVQELFGCRDFVQSDLQKQNVDWVPPKGNP